MLTDFLFSLENIFNASWLLGLGASFLAGVIASLSPCFYPLIPVTLGVVGVVAVSSRRRGFFISSIFVLGICVTYTTLGIAASWLGIFLGAFYINPFTYIVLAVAFFLLGLSCLGVIKLSLPFFNFYYTPRRRTIALFIMGMISGLAIIPCNFPVLGPILSLIALKRNVFYGGVALFVFSLGQGLILIILGTFTSLIRKLPKSGPWLVTIKKILGAVLVVVGVFFFIKFISLIR